MPYQWIEVLDLPDEVPAGGAPAVKYDVGSYWEFEQAVTMRQAAGANAHFQLQNLKENKNIRIGSRSLTGDSGDHSAIQSKPNRSVDGTGSVTAAEFSPRFAAGIGGANLVGIKVDPLLKAGSGNLSGQVAGVQVNIDFGTSGTRTITGDIAAFETFLAVPSAGMTYSGLVTVMRVRDVNIRGWDAFLNLDSSTTGVTTDADKDANNASHTLKVYVGSTLFHIQLYADS